eukprot:762790-Hanusia_phi.AAC.7
MGNKGSLTDGDCQWMTAGGKDHPYRVVRGLTWLRSAGILHNEGTNHPGGYLHGFQCWINLPKDKKMTPPAYQDIRSSSIPVVTCNDKVKAKVIAGSCAGQDAVCQTIIPVQYIDFMVEPGGEFLHEVPAEMETRILYVYKGSVMVGPEQVVAKEVLSCPVPSSLLLPSSSSSIVLSFVWQDGGNDVRMTRFVQSGQLCKIKGTMKKI